jgi:hypothetical protein
MVRKSRVSDVNLAEKNQPSIAEADDVRPTRVRWHVMLLLLLITALTFLDRLNLSIAGKYIQDEFHLGTQIGFGVPFFASEMMLCRIAISSGACQTITKRVAEATKPEVLVDFGLHPTSSKPVRPDSRSGHVPSGTGSRVHQPPVKELRIEQKLHAPPSKIRSISSLPIRSKSSGTDICPAIS